MATLTDTIRKKKKKKEEEEVVEEEEEEEVEAVTIFHAVEDFEDIPGDSNWNLF